MSVLRMNRSEYSYLDLTVMPFLRRKVISSDAAILFDEDITKVLWANAVGTELFGGNGIFGLLGLELSEKHSLVRQLKNAARQINDRDPVERGFRVARGLKSELMQGELTKTLLPNGEESLLLVFGAHGKSTKMREHELAVMAVDALDDFADAAAIVDEYGLVLASSAGFDTLDIDADTLETLIGVVAREDDRLVKRKIEIGSGHFAAAGLGRIRDTPGRFLIVIADTNDQPNEVDEDVVSSDPSQEPEMRGLLLDSHDDSEKDDFLETRADDGPLPPWLEEDEVIQEHSSIDAPITAEVEASKTASEPAPAFVRSDQEEASAPTPDRSDLISQQAKTKESGSLLDRWYFSDNTEKSISAKTEPPKDDQDTASNNKQKPEADVFKTSASLEQETNNEEENTKPIFDPTLPDLPALAANDASEAEGDIIERNELTPSDEAPVVSETPFQQPRRFAFSIDRFQVIKSVSPELAAAVGEHSGNILDKHWKAISKERGFDENDAILSVLEKADTWSGKSVLWPVDETDMVVPVDLAALPVFDRERNFDGFRGFGVIRMDDAIVDPNGLGFQIAAETAPDELAKDTDAKTSQSDIDDDSAFARPVWGTNLDAEDREELSSGHIEEEAKAPTSDSWQQPKADNVFQLSSGRKPVNSENRNIEPAVDDGSDEQLSGKEQRAFSEISRSLIEKTQSEDISGDEAELAPSPENSPLASAPLLETLPVPLFVYRADKTLFANDALLKLTGYASTQEIADAGGIEALLSDRNALNTSDAKGMKLIKKDGAKIDIRSRLTSISWEDDKALCLTFAEILGGPVEEKAALDMIRVSELENILETAADGILVIDQDGKIESLNASGEALFGLEQKSVIGKSFGKLFATESRQALETYIRDLNAPGVSGVMNQGQQVIGVEAGGGLIPLFATLGRVGNSNRYCAVLRDLTEWKKNEEELVEAKRNAETASEQKSEFLSRISHEIREPLTAIIGFSDVMIEERFGKIDNERYREYLKDINRSGIHVLDLVNDLLDISKIEAGKLELSYEAVDLNQLAAETVALLQPQANNKRILIRTSLSRAVPKVVADARSVRQIILNLVSNAINHSPKNSQVIVSTTFEANSEVGLRIRDTGEGMSEEEIQRALQPFTQVGSSNKAGHTGSGLGLPLTKALIEANRAYFELESTPGEGTIAHIQFPSQRVLAD